MPSSRRINSHYDDQIGYEYNQFQFGTNFNHGHTDYINASSIPVDAPDALFRLPSTVDGGFPSLNASTEVEFDSSLQNINNYNSLQYGENYPFFMAGQLENMSNGFQGLSGTAPAGLLSSVHFPYTTSEAFNGYVPSALDNLNLSDGYGSLDGSHNSGTATQAFNSFNTIDNQYILPDSTGGGIAAPGNYPRGCPRPSYRDYPAAQGYVASDEFNMGCQRAADTGMSQEQPHPTWVGEPVHLQQGEIVEFGGLTQTGLVGGDYPVHTTARDNLVHCEADMSCITAPKAKKDMNRHYWTTHPKWALDHKIPPMGTVCEKCDTSLRRKDYLSRHQKVCKACKK
ncbi:hypothetical protein BX600DRAFT_540831 [Xylariales sp. PMI_506]|nr:hypothetical protein BX600DRAFT_540831 [Xylariales sp. PMI_506]